MKKIVIRTFAAFLLLGLNIVKAQDDVAVEQEIMQAEHQIQRGEMMKKVKMRQKQRMMNDHLSGLDKNGDGKVELAEYLSSAEERFNNMDLNGDNYVTSDEAKEAHKQIRDKQMEARLKNREQMRAKHEKTRQKHQEQMRENNDEKESKDDSE